MGSRLARAWRLARFVWGYFRAHLALIRANRRAVRLEAEREKAEEAGRVLGFPDCTTCGHVIGFGAVTCAECRRALEGLARAATAIGISPRDMAAASVRLSYELVSTEHTIGPFSLNLEEVKPAAFSVSLLPVEVRLPLCRACAARIGSELSRRARRACK